MNVRLVPNPTSQSIQKLAEHEGNDAMVDTLKSLIRETCRLRNEGVAYAKLAHSQGYADGYMRLLMDAGFLSQKEVLELVSQVRRGVDGPATRTLSAQNLAPASAALSA